MLSWESLFCSKVRRHFRLGFLLFWSLNPEPFFLADGEDVYVRRHKDKQSKMLRNGSGPSTGLPCRPDWKYTGTDTRLGKPLYRGPCSICGRESTVPFKPVVNGQPPRCRTCLPQDGNFAAAGGYAPQAMPPPRYEDARDGGLMSLRKETLRTLSVGRGGSGVFLYGGGESGRSGPPHYGMDHQGFGDIARAQSFAGGDVSRALAEASRGHGDVSKFAREYGSSVTGSGAPPQQGEYRRTSSLSSADWSFSHPGERDGFVSGGSSGGFSGGGASEAMAKRFEGGWGVEERRGGFQNPSSNGGGFGVGMMSANGAGGKYGGSYQQSYLE